MPQNQLIDTFNDVLTIIVPYSQISRYDRSGNLKPLANTIEPANSASINPVKRFIISTAGIFFLMVGLIGLLGNNSNLISVLCLLFGVLIIWTFLARPEIAKRKAAVSSRNAQDSEVSVLFNKLNIIMRSPHDEVKKDWSELAQYKKTKKGIHLNFNDGSEAWLPFTAFYGDELKQLTNLVELMRR
ncbi:MAG: hypothetical protein ACYDHW_03200 [Syntrophorhabdaceae bacterium]